MRRFLSKNRHFFEMGEPLTFPRETKVVPTKRYCARASGFLMLGMKIRGGARLISTGLQVIVMMFMLHLCTDSLL
jgi:hypothetical protein